MAEQWLGIDHYNDQDQATLGPVNYPNGRSAVAIFADRPLLQPPGQAYRYSSWGFTLLGALVEQRSGLPFPDYVMREVTPGLAIMRDATDGPDSNASSAYEFAKRVPVRAKPIDFSYTWAGGGMAATPTALATFGGRMVNDRIVKHESFDLAGQRRRRWRDDRASRRSFTGCAKRLGALAPGKGGSQFAVERAVDRVDRSQRANDRGAAPRASHGTDGDRMPVESGSL
jgi:CubicO group peptidase (beta-lactamase class C family)